MTGIVCDRCGSRYESPFSPKRDNYIESCPHCENGLHKDKYLVFKINRLPHPQREHLSSRTRNIGTLNTYSDECISFTTVNTNVDTLKEYVLKYLKDQNVEVKDVQEYESLRRRIK